LGQRAATAEAACFEEKIETHAEKPGSRRQEAGKS
jgi:hypothetical protein